MVAFYAFPFARELARRTIETEWMADAAALCVVFLVPLIAIKVNAAAAVNHIPDGALGTVDRFADARSQQRGARSWCRPHIWA